VILKTTVVESQRAYRFVLGKDWGFKKFIRRDYLLDEANGLLPDDKLTIFCEVSIVSDIVNLTGQNNALQLKVPNSCTLAEDIGSLFTEDQFADFTIQVDNAKIKVHKCVLSARSPVFKAMLSHKGLAESNNDSVLIKDLDEETVRGMLHFIYSGHVPDLQHIAFRLLAAADKYELKRLKSLCEHSLCGSLSTHNACDILVHSDLHSAEQLKSHCISFINQHATTVMNTEGWNLLSRELMSELYAAVVASHKTHAPVQITPPARKRARH